MSLGYIWDIQGIYWDMQAPTKQAFPKLNILTRFSGTGGRQNRCSLDSGIAYQSHFGPQLGKERKVQTRTELWNNTPKKTLRYKVEKRVRTHFSTLYLKVVFDVLFHNSVLVGTFRSLSLHVHAGSFICLIYPFKSQLHPK